MTVDHGLGPAPTIGVVIPAWNAARFLRDAVESVFAQTVQPTDLVIVDDGSTDDTGEVAASLADTFKGVRLIGQRNLGAGAARDAGIREVRGELVALLDADDRWLPNKLERQIAFLARHREVMAVFAHVQNVFDGVAPRGPTGAIAGYLPSAMLVRRQCLDEVGSFTAEGPLSDWIPWFLRLREQVPTGMVDELLVLRRVHDANTGLRERDQRAAYVRHVGEALRRRTHRPT
jgi:glycosyltransferase involved in cell wall biosynthesis